MLGKLDVRPCVACFVHKFCQKSFLPIFNKNGFTWKHERNKSSASLPFSNKFLICELLFPKAKLFGSNADFFLKNEIIFVAKYALKSSYVKWHEL